MPAAFKKHEDYYKGADAHARRRRRVAGGERQRLRWDILDAFAQAAQQAGIPHSEDFNRGDNEGVGYFQVNQKNGWRWNTAKAFLRPICYGRPNFEMWTCAQVTRLLDRARRPTAASAAPASQVWTGNEMVTVHAHARGDPVRGQHRLAADPAAVGHRPGRRCCSSTASRWCRTCPGVGANLQDHLQIRAVFKVKGVATLNTLATSWLGKAKIGLEYALKRSGPMSMAPSQLGAFTRSSPDMPYPNIEYHVQPLSLDAFGEPLHSFNAFTASVCNLNPTSRGTRAHPQQQASRTRRRSRPTT